MDTVVITRAEAIMIVRMLGRAISGTPLSDDEDAIACEIQDRLTDVLGG